MVDNGVKDIHGMTASPLIILCIITNLREFLCCYRLGYCNDVIMAETLLAISGVIVHKNCAVLLCIFSSLLISYWVKGNRTVAAYSNTGLRKVL